MSLGKKLFHQDAAAATGDADSAQGLILHLDANDEDSIESGGANQGNGSGTWFDIANHDLNVPLVDKASDLKLHLNASDTSSYGGSGLVWTDLSGEGNNGAISNTSVSFQTDTRGYFDLDGTDDTITVTHDTDFNPSTSDLTFEVWVQRGDTTNEQTILSKGGGVTGYFLNYTTTSNVGYYFYDYGSTSYVRSGTSVSNGVGEWDHVVVTWDLSAKSFDMYVNGTLSNATQVNASGTPSSTTSDLLISTNDATRGHPHWDGLINVVRIYATKFTASEVAQNYRAGNFLSYSSIYSTDLEMNLDAANYTSGSTWTDSSGNGNNGAISSVSSTTFDKELGNHLNFSEGQTSGASTMSTNRLTVSSFAALRTSTNFAIEIWLKSSTASSDGMIWNVYDSSGGTKFSLSWNSSKLRWAVHNASGTYKSAQDVFTTNTFSTNTWLHIVATYNNGTEQKIYVNGIQDGAASNPNEGTNTTTTTQMRWGDRADGYAVDTQIGQARFYSAALTPAQVAQNYLATKNDYPNGHNATIYGSTFGTNSSSPNESRFVFDGSNDYMHLDTYVHPNISLYSISMFIKFADATPGSNKYFLSNITTSNNEITSNIHFGLLTTGNFVIMVGDGSGLDNFQTASGLSDDTYAHLVFTFDGVNDEVKYYKDGSLQSTNSSITRIGSQNAQADLYIGRYGQSGLFYTAMTLGQFKIFHKVLSSSEVTAEFDAHKATYGLS